MKRETIRKVFRYIRSERIFLLLSLLLSAVHVYTALRIPILVGDAIDAATLSESFVIGDLSRPLILVAVLTLVSAVSQWCAGLANNRLSFGVVHAVRRDAFHRLQKLPISYADTHKTGDTVNRMIADADTFADGLLVGLTQLFSGILTIIGTLILMIRIQPWIALAVFLITPLSLFAARFIARRTHKMFGEQSRIRGEQTAFMNEVVGNQKVVKAFGREAEMTRDFEEISGRLRTASLRATFFSSLVNPTTRFVNALVYAAVALIGAFAIGNAGSAFGAGLTIGAFNCLLSYANQYTKPFNEIAGVVTELQNAAVSAERLFEIIDAEPETPEKDGVMPEARGEIVFRNVSFSYTKDRSLIQNVNFRADAGMHVAIVGPTGCGKTTLINLLMRFYDVDSGSITLDGTDIRDLTRGSLREKFGMVLQDSFIKNATVRDNIRLGKPDASDEEVVAAARAARADSFIRRLENGYDTMLSEDGGSLSEGQKQLLSITRVMLSLPPILILDEATSSIDTRTEKKIQDAIDRLSRGRTAFIVAHRLSTVKNADLILVMRDGNIIETGTHGSLLAKNGFYKELYNSQFAAEAKEQEDI